MAPEDAIEKLARQIEAAEKAERFRVDAEYVAGLRRQGACDLHRICADLVSQVNGRAGKALLELSPPAFSAEAFRDGAPNLLQISVQGRQIQIAFESPPELSSTVKFAIPYVLEGEIRAYNQRMLEHLEVRSRLIFYCVEGEGAVWRFFDWRTRSTGVLTGDVLAGFFQPLF